MSTVFVLLNSIGVKRNIRFILRKESIFLNVFNSYKHPFCLYGTAPNLNVVNQRKSEFQNKVSDLIDKYEDKIIYSSVIEAQKFKLGYRKNRALEQKLINKEKKKELERGSIQPLPVSLRYLNKTDSENDSLVETKENTTVTQAITQFPFEHSDVVTETNNSEEKVNDEAAENIQDEILIRKADYDLRRNWMTDYENYDDNVLEEDNAWMLNYGTPDPTSSISNVPCGGCGALLHCKVCISIIHDIDLRFF